MKEIKIKKAYYPILVDDEDFGRASLYGWCLSKGGILATIKTKTIQLGRFILNYDGPLQVDHKDNNIYNNQKSNLRIATRSLNCHNRPNPGGASMYRGVTYRKDNKKWRAQIRIQKSLLNIGTYQTEEEAARAYDKEARRWYGKDAQLNFKEN